MNQNDDQHIKISIYKGAISGTRILAVTNDCVIGLEGKHTWYWRLRQLLRANEIMDLRKESKDSS